MSPAKNLNLDQIKLISTINSFKSDFWRVTYEVVGDQFVISIKSHSDVLDSDRLIAKVTHDENHKCLLIEYAIDSMVLEKFLIKDNLTHLQALPVYIV